MNPDMNPVRRFCAQCGQELPAASTAHVNIAGDEMCRGGIPENQIPEGGE
jgi:hypothetical protein